MLRIARELAGHDSGGTLRDLHCGLDRTNTLLVLRASRGRGASCDVSAFT